MRKYFALIALIFGFFGNAQILNPVQWKTKVVQKSATEFELVMDATIENEWHMYSQFTPENGPLPTVFDYKNAKGQSGRIHHVVGEGHQIDVHRVEHQFHRHQDADGVPASQDAV